MEQKADRHSEQDTNEDGKAESNNQFLSDDDEDEHIHEADNSNNDSDNSLITCLFCQHPSNDFHDNLEHMKKTHGFFLPDIEYLTDSEGLITYLLEKINTNNLCLYCNGKGKQWQTAIAARAHMLDKGHCKMAYDQSEDPEQLLKFYDFGTLEEDMDIDVASKGDDNELVLENGVKLGNRKFAKFYKQYKQKKVI
jgi:pre-60S factor REI1